jgi:hypothetical protein
VPHLTPLIRGIHATLYAKLTADIDLQSLFEQRYAGEAFVDVMPAGTHPETRSVRGANVCRIAVHRPQGGDMVVVLSVIDNLVKGGGRYIRTSCSPARTPRWPTWGCCPDGGGRGTPRSEQGLCLTQNG